ncbi:MAG: hypothetical protein U9Q72_02495 [Patescibacteria group bacterium]|nr:hypothetical protein [Patescibacteria group bacterium]
MTKELKYAKVWGSLIIKSNFKTTLKWEEEAMRTVRIILVVTVVLVGIAFSLGSGGSSSDEERVENNLEIEVEHRVDTSKVDCLVSGSITWNPDKGEWVARVNYYNGTPEPGNEHPVFEYVKFLPVPDWEGTDWETLDWEGFPCDLNDLELNYFGNQLEIEIKNLINPSKVDCLVSGSITWNPNKEAWVSRVNYYNETPEPSLGHPAFEHVRFLPVPGWEGYAWEAVDWKGFPCDWGDLNMRLFIPE